MELTKKNNGFTITELTILITVILLLFAVLYIVYTKTVSYTSQMMILEYEDTRGQAVKAAHVNNPQSSLNNSISKSIPISIVNATGETGYARELQAYFMHEGFINVSVEKKDIEQEYPIIIHIPGNEKDVREAIATHVKHVYPNTKIDIVPHTTSDHVKIYLARKL